MASIKYKGKWYDSSSLPLEIKIELGLNSEVLKELEAIQPDEKKSPVKKAKKDDD